MTYVMMGITEAKLLCAHLNGATLSLLLMSTSARERSAAPLRASVCFPGRSAHFVSVALLASSSLLDSGRYTFTGTV